MSKDRVRVFFPGLNGLRFFAALAVVVSHLEMVLRFKGIQSHWYWLEGRMQFNAFMTIKNTDTLLFSYLISLAGYCGVIFFFVLSGFLITYLMLVEKEQEGHIDIKSFYVRRLLRIWPLYYFLIFLGFFVLPKISWFEVAEQTAHFAKNFRFNLLSYVFMLPNLAASYKIWHVPNIGQLWSIGVEEQFYLFWPLLMRVFIKSIKSIFYFIFILVVIKAFVWFSPFFTEGFVRFIGSLKFESMAVGAIGAFWWYYNKGLVSRLFFSGWSQLIAYLSVFIFLLFLPYSIFESIYLFLSVPFLIIILNVSCNPKSIIKLRNKIVDYLGRISYGIYMYHFLVVTFVVNFLVEMMILPQYLYLWQRILLHAVSITVTVLISALSYKYLERPFISAKAKFTKVLSGDMAKKGSG